MTLFIAVVFLFTAPAYQIADTSLIEHTHRQVNRYVQAVQQNNDQELNLWALAKITQDRADIQRYLVKYLSNQGFGQPAFDVFRDTTLNHSGKLQKLAFVAESPLLLTTYMLAEPDINRKKNIVQQFENEIGYPASSALDYQTIIDKLLRGESISSDLLPSASFHPLHFFFFTNGSVMRAGTFSSEYLEEVTEQWNFTASQSLKQSLGLIALSRILYVLEKYDLMEKLYQPIIANRSFPSSPMKLKVFELLDYSMYRLGYYNRSINITRNYSLPLANYLGRQKTALNLQVDLGLSLYQIGKIEDSKQVYLDARDKSEELNIPIPQSILFNNLAITYWKSGEFDKFLSLQFQALEESKKEDNYEIKMKVLRNLFTHYRINKDFASAKQYLKQAETLAKDQQNNLDLAQLTYNEGQLYRDAESDFKQAIHLFNKALSLISYDEYYSSFQNILTQKAQLFEKQGKYIEAKQFYQRVLKNARERNDIRNILAASFNKTNTYLSLGQIDSAQVILDTLNTGQLNNLDFSQLVKAKSVQARYQSIKNHPKYGIEILQPVVEQIVKRSRSSGDLETGFWQVESEYLDAFEQYANLLIKTDQQEKAVEVLDQLKTINDAALYQNPLVRSKVLNEEELSQYKRLTENLDQLRKQLLTALPEKQNSIQQQIDELSAQKSTLDNRISAQANPAPVSVNQIQRRMNAHQRVLHITELNNTYYFATIARTSVEFNKIPITQAMRSGFEENIEKMAQGTVDLTHLYTLTKLLEIENLPVNVNELTIIPDSYLYQLPLDILPLNKPASDYSYGDTKYLIERYETNYMTSLNDLISPAKNSHFTYGYAGYGISEFEEDREMLIPLPEAKTEIEIIANQLTAFDNKKTFLNEFATEETFREAAPGARILHLATHSEVTNQDPMLSSIYLSRSDTDTESKFPGRIFAYELFELNLSNELIMLNSCESGSGSYLQGTGVVGISRALRYAGAESLILNLWSVNDMMASDFAVKFYEGINKGKSKSDALRSAKLHFLKTKNANPHYWGSYMLLGDKEAILQSNTTLNNIVASSFMLFFLSLAIASSYLTIQRRRNS